MEPLPPPMSDPLPIPPVPAAPASLDYESARLAPGKGGLIAMSVVFFLIGAMTACGTLTMPLAMLNAPRGGGPTAAAVAAMVALYGALAVACIWTGVGCCRARRWVRPVVLAVAWPWLLMGCVGLVAIIVMLIQTQGRMAASNGPASPGLPPAAFMTVMMITAAVFGGIFYVGIPVLVIWFFQRRQTAQALWFYDPFPGWADRCPIPVFAWSLWAGLGALGMLGAMAYGVVPVFGVIVTGVPAAAVLALVAGVMLCIAVGSYLLKPWAWWLSLAHTLILSASWLTLLLRGRFPDYLAHITRSAPPPTTGPSFQFQQEMFTSVWLLSVGIVGMLVWIGFLVYLRRYFLPLPAATASQAA